MTNIPMDIVIVGAGIAGLSAGIGLRQAGHRVTIFEQSSLLNETGAAITITPNASRVLDTWGFKPERSKFVSITVGSIFNGTTLENIVPNYFGDLASIYGMPLYSSHRVDLHSQLKELALAPDGAGIPVKIRTSARVIKYNATEGEVVLADQTTIQADLVVAADGVHSKAVEHVLGTTNERASDTGWGTMRWLVPTEEILADPDTAPLVQDSKQRYFVGSRGTGALVWYPCRNNEVQNFLYLSQSFELAHATEDFRANVEPDLVKEHAAKDFHPKLQAVLAKAREVKFWKLVARQPIPSWHKDKLVLIGDAAHPMLTFQAQGGGQAIEDGAALGVLLKGVTGKESLAKQLRMFEKVRRGRGSSIQLLSNAPHPQPQSVRDAASEYLANGMKFQDASEVNDYVFSFDVIQESRKLAV